MREVPALDDAMRVDLLRTMILLRTFHDAIRREAGAAARMTGPERRGGVGGRDQEGGDVARRGGMRRSLLGCEPMAAAFGLHLSADDAVTAPRQPHYMAIARGIDLRLVVHDAVGTVHGHSDPSADDAPADANVRSLRPSTTGVGYLPSLGQAFAFRENETSQVALSILGRRTVEEDGFGEAVSLASTWQLPLVFLVCDDQGPVRSHEEVREELGAFTTHGIKGVRVTSDVLEAAYYAAGEAVHRARSGEGPSLVEVLTMWPRPESDPATAERRRGPEMAHDPLPAFESALRQADLVDDEALTGMHSEASYLVAQAISEVAEGYREGPEPCPVCARQTAS